MDPAEECDGDDLAGQACEDFGLGDGTLQCNVDCIIDTSECGPDIDAPVLELSLSQVKRFDFSWAPVAGADHYRLEQSTAPGEPFVQLGEQIVGDSISHSVPLHLRWQARYRLQACTDTGCVPSPVVDVMGTLEDAVGYVKASNTGTDDWFGFDVAVSGDGTTLAVSAPREDSDSQGIDGDQENHGAGASGAVYVFTRDQTGVWTQQAYIKASNSDVSDAFGWGISLSDDGNTLAVGAPGESSSATGIDGDQSQVNNHLNLTGAVYLFSRDGMGTWTQRAYLKASNSDEWDQFGRTVALSGDGQTLAVGASGEGSGATGINGDQGDLSMPDAGAVYIFQRSVLDTWSQQAYIKASNTDEGDLFGYGLAISTDGNTLAVGALGERSVAAGVDGDQDNDWAYEAGAVYVFVRDAADTWTQQAYVKASNPDSQDQFFVTALSGDGDTLAVGALQERSGATGIDGNQADDSVIGAGAVYVFARDEIGTWSQQAYVKPSNTNARFEFGSDVALNEDGNVLVVGARQEISDATGINGEPSIDNPDHAGQGAAYLFIRDEMGAWSQYAYIKSSNPTSYDHFGQSVAISDDAGVLVVGARFEDSSSTGVSSDLDEGPGAGDAGAVYLY